MKLETEIMREQAREERNQKRLASLLRIFAGIMAFLSGMCFMTIFLKPDAKGVGFMFAISFVGTVLLWVGGER